MHKLVLVIHFHLRMDSLTAIFDTVLNTSEPLADAWILFIDYCTINVRVFQCSGFLVRESHSMYISDWNITVIRIFSYALSNFVSNYFLVSVFPPCDMIKCWSYMY